MDKELNKIRYLVGHGSNRKLKRNVPKRLQSVAGKTAWVVRGLSELSASQIRERASIFAVNTDAEIKAWERELVKTNKLPTSKPDNPRAPEFTETEANQLAISYFWKQNEELRQTHLYKIDDDHPYYVDHMQDAGFAISEAEKRLSYPQSCEDFRVLEVLINANLLEPVPKSNEEKSQWLSDYSSHPKVKLLTSLIYRADLELAYQRLQSLTNMGYQYHEDRFFAASTPLYADANPITFPKQLTEASEGVKTVGDLVEAFLASKKNEVTKSRYDQFQIPARIATEFFGKNTRINEIADHVVMEVLDFLPQVPAHVTKRYGDMSLRQAAEAFEKDNGQKPNRYEEAKKTLSALGQIFKYSMQRKWLGACNPFDNLKIEVPVEFRKKHYQNKEHGYAPYSVEELNKIFSSDVYTAIEGRSYFPAGTYKKTRPGQLVRDQMYWLPLLAIWTGARMNELLQLECADVRSERDIHYIHVTDEAEIEYLEDNFTKRVKNPNAVRDIPLHPFIVQLGFVDWAHQANKGRIFPDAHRGNAEKPSLTFSKNYRQLCEKKLGVWQKQKKVFHSFRNNFNDELRNCGVSYENRVAINGWEEQQKMDGLYGRGLKIEKLYENGISKIEYSDVDWQAVKTSLTVI